MMVIPDRSDAELAKRFQMGQTFLADRLSLHLELECLEAFDLSQRAQKSGEELMPGFCMTASSQPLRSSYLEECATSQSLMMERI